MRATLFIFFFSSPSSSINDALNTAYPEGLFTQTLFLFKPQGSFSQLLGLMGRGLSQGRNSIKIGNLTWRASTHQRKPCLSRERHFDLNELSPLERDLLEKESAEPALLGFSCHLSRSCGLQTEDFSFCLVPVYSFHHSTPLFP